MKGSPALAAENLIPAVARTVFVAVGGDRRPERSHPDCRHWWLQSRFRRKGRLSNKVR